ncbi:hypothetical protein AX17_005188 [Amanita inopinata Kibby_2008]|nr:hypothetical protein AX17_005188 [Amanita inopinata Kibby_2008]
MSIARQLFNEFRPLFRMLEEPFMRPPTYYARQPRTLLGDPFENAFSSRPAIDVTEEGNKYILDADLPGMKKENVEVRIGDNGRSITIEGKFAQKSQEAPPSEEPVQGEGVSNQISTERFHTMNSSFTRTVWLPRPVDTQDVSARLQDGVLTVTVNKAEDKGSTVVAVE